MAIVLFFPVPEELPRPSLENRNRFALERDRALAQLDEQSTRFPARSVLTACLQVPGQEGKPLAQTALFLEENLKAESKSE